MPKVTIDTINMPSPFPFLTWTQAAIRKTLKHHGFRLDLPYKKEQITEHCYTYEQKGDLLHVPQIS